MSAEQEREISRLARAFQEGDRSTFAALHHALWPLMATALRRYRDRPQALPAALERGDLVQQSWLILADLVARWQPEGGSFMAYFRVSFPWVLARYIRRNSPSRRSKGVLVLGAECPDVQEQLDAYPGADGREWDEALAWTEWLEPLGEQERAVLRLHLVDQQPFTAVAQALQLTRPATYRLYRRALRCLQVAPSRADESPMLVSAADLNLDRQDDLVKLVQALHDGARTGGRLPGRDWLADRTGFSEQRLTHLINLLVEAGCVRDRAPRRPGRLVHPTPDQTLAALGIDPAEPAS